jgi:nitroreductase
MNSIIKALNWRYATKAYDTSKKLDDKDVNTIIESGILAPSSYGLEPYRFVLVKDPAIRAKLREAAWGQPQITDASHLVVLSVRTDVDEKYVDAYMDLISKERGVAVDSLKGFADMIKGTISKLSKDQVIEWNKRQAYIALGTMLTTSALAGIDSTPMEGFDPSAFDSILGLKDSNLTTAVVMALGIRSKDDSYSTLKKVRFTKEEMVITK